jgi:ABC-type uncharacterized transport system permease subunit
MVVGDLLILSFGQSPARSTAAARGDVGERVRLRAGAVQGDDAHASPGSRWRSALRAGLFNIGAESQLAAAASRGARRAGAPRGDAGAALACSSASSRRRSAAALVGAVPGALKARFGAHEVIVTIMLNFIVLALLNYIVAAQAARPRHAAHAGDPRGRACRGSDGIRVHRLGGQLRRSCSRSSRRRCGGTSSARGAATSCAPWGCSRTRRSTAACDVGGVTWRAHGALGRIAGLGGVNYVLGYKHYYEEGFAAAPGFLGIAVALVGRNHPVGVVLAALLFATLSQGGLAVNALVPKQMVDVLQAVVILAVATSVPEVRLLRCARRGPR